MSNLTAWRFKGTPTTYQSPSDSFEISVSKLRKALGFSPLHQIEILNNGSNQSTPDSVDHSDSNIDPDQPTTVSKAPKSTKTKSTTSELFTVPGDLDSPSPESELL